LKPNFSPAFPPYSESERQKQLTEHTTVDKGHGRITKRHLQASTRLAGHLDWPGLKQVCRIERVVKAKGKTTTEIAYAISSLTAERAGADKLLSYNRGHWGIESHHWVRDVSLGEDACRANMGHSPQNLAAFRNVSLSLLRLSGVNEILSTLRDFASRPYELLKFLRIMKK
jgi:predicted transposase YbfD/YdcC